MNDCVKFYYPAVRMFEADKLEFKFGREPTLRRMPDGSLISLVYSGGPGEPSDANFVAVIRSDDDGETWSMPQRVFESASHAVWGTEIFTEGEMPFAVIHTFHKQTRYQEINCYRSFTPDSGQTWSSPEAIPGIPQSISIRQGKVLSNGDWIFPVYWGENIPNEKIFSSYHMINGHSKYVCGAIISQDKGNTFSFHGYLPAPDDRTAWEPEIVEIGDGKLQMLIRCNGLGALLCSESTDYGRTWTTPEPIEVPNPGTKITTYKVGDRHVLFTNTYDKHDELNRRKLEAWVTSDFKTWDKKITIAEVTDINEKSINVTYPHGFVDDEKGLLYLAVDSYFYFTLLKIPLKEFK